MSQTLLSDFTRDEGNVFIGQALKLTAWHRSVFSSGTAFSLEHYAATMATWLSTTVANTGFKWRHNVLKTSFTRRPLANSQCARMKMVTAMFSTKMDRSESSRRWN